MGQDTFRIEHDLAKLPSHVRDEKLDQILNDLIEEITDKGYSEPVYNGNKEVTSITTWRDNTKTFKRMLVTFTLTGHLVTQQVQTVYDETNDSIVMATVTTDFVYDSNKLLTSMNTVIVRP